MDLIDVPATIRSWSTVTLRHTDELVTLRYFEKDSKVVLLPIFPEKKPRHEIVFVVGDVESIQNTELLDLLYQQITTCFSRLYKHMRIADNKEALLTTLFKLCADLGGLGAVEMQIKIVNYLLDELCCESCCLLIAEEETQNFVCQVVGSTVLESEFYTSLRGGFFGIIARSRQSRIMKHFTLSEQNMLQKLFDMKVTSLLCVPILSQSSKEVICLVCAANKSENKRFSVSDVSDIETCLRYTWTLLSSSIALQKEKKAKNECQSMLQIAKNLFTHLDDVTILLGQIVQEARALTDAERCSVFLVNKESEELVAKVFDGIVTVDESLDPRQYDFESMNEVRIPLSRGIAGHVATTGKTLNITDAYSHPLFYRGIDEATGFTTRNVLCFPIKDDAGDVVGVSQLCNKLKGRCFTQYDVELAERFAVFSGISISHSLLYKQVIEVQCRNQLANELMTYHMKIREEDVGSCLGSLPTSVTEFGSNFSKFIYIPRDLSPDLQCSAVIQMYFDLGLVSRFHINTRTLAKFVLMVKEGYRNPPYHNWDHAFSVAHHAYSLAKNLDFENVFGDLEALALLTGSLCHDIDHRGTNNAFQISSKSTLAALYSSQGSVLEQHHFAQAMSILNSGSCNIFENMSNTKYVKVLDLVKGIILATDLGRHLQILPTLNDMAKRKLVPKECNKEQKMMILHLCMTACDLSDQTKGWRNTKNTAHLIYKEFFHQGDMEKSMGGRPAIINDRDRACVPELQINFMEHIAGPVYKVLAEFFPTYNEVYERYNLNVERWKKVLQKFKDLGIPSTGSLDFLTEEFDRDLFTDGLSEAPSKTSVKSASETSTAEVAP